jgi:thioesterase-3
MLPAPEVQGMTFASFDLRVHGFHCDLYGHVNHARYLEFLEAARWEMLGDTVELGAWHDQGRRFVIVRVDVSYRAAATLGDDLVVRTWGGEIGKSSARVHQDIVRTSDQKTIVEATITYVILDANTGRPLRLEGELADALGRMPRQPHGGAE